MTGYLLGVDLGTSSVKVLVTTAAGEIIGRGEAGYPINTPAAGMAEQDPQLWWSSMVDAVRQALLVDPVLGNKVACIGLSGQMHGTVLLDGSGLPLAPAVIWSDQRSQEQVREITEMVGAKEIIRITGSPVATGFQAATIRWFQENRPEIWGQVRKVLLPKDYIRWRLTGEFRTDPSDASATCLFEVRQDQWSHEIADTLGINEGLLPQVVPSDAVVGRVGTEAAREMGITSKAVVVAGAGDVACGLLGAGVVGDQQLLLTVSTGGQLAGPNTHGAVDLNGRLHTFRSALGPDEKEAKYFHLGAILAAGLSLRWLRGEVLQGGEQLTYQELISWAADVPAGSDGLLFLPYLAGERTPHMNPLVRGAFIGLTLRHSRSHMVRAVLEGVCYACYDAFLVLKELGASQERIIMAGGGARSPLWRQITADIFGMEVVSPLVLEQAAFGAAMLAASGTGYLKLIQAAKEWTSHDTRVAPDLRRHRLYQEQFVIFRKVYGAVQN